MEKSQVLYLSQSDVKALIGTDLRWVIDSCEKSLLFTKDYEATPIYTDVDQAARPRWMLTIPAVTRSSEINFYGCHISSATPKGSGLPGIFGFSILYDRSTGVPLAIIDANIQEFLLTACMSAVGSRYLAKKDSKVLGIIGLGGVGRAQLRTHQIVLPNLREVNVYDVYPKFAEQYAKEMRNELNIDVNVVDNPRDTVVNADVLITCTSADEPIVKSAWCPEGLLYTHVGSRQEEEYDVIKNADKIIINNWETLQFRKHRTLIKMYSEGLITRDQIYAEFHEIVSKKKPGRTSDTEKIYYMHAGGCPQGQMLDYELYKAAIKKGIGIKLDTH